MEIKPFNIGTSGWSYAGWHGNFYPKKIKASEVLAYYANLLNSVELNNSFYQTPKEHNIQKWVEITPADFIFSCKANRYITHFQRLKDCSESVARLISAFKHFENKLGPILFQFPPSLGIDIPVLQHFIELLPKDLLYTFEFRHQNWFCNELYDLLHRHNMSLCFYDHKMVRSPEVVTGPFIYIRMHGPTKEAYKGAYEEKTLVEYAEKIRHWAAEKKDIYCYFDNDEKANAPKDAQRLALLLKS